MVMRAVSNNLIHNLSVDQSRNAVSAGLHLLDADSLFAA